MSLTNLIKNNKLAAAKGVSAVAAVAGAAGYGIQSYVASLPLWKRSAAAVIDSLGFLGTVTSPAIHAAYHASELPHSLYMNALAAGAIGYITADIVQRLSKR